MVRNTTVRNVTELCHMVAEVQPVSEEDAIARLRKVLFKGTSCGISFGTTEGGIYAAGYAEGTDADCPVHELKFPFTLAEFWRTVGEADNEGCALFDEVHNAEEDQCDPTP